MNNTTSTKNSKIQTSFLDSFKNDKNTDRVRFLQSNFNNESELLILSAGYQLEKENKTGSLNLHTINQNKFINNQKLNLDYGILDFKISKNVIYTSNSDCSFSIFNYGEAGIEFQDKFNLPNLKNQENTCNTLDINNLNFDSTLLFAMNDGSHHIYDMNELKCIESINSHEYGLWSCLVVDQNMYMTGSEDSLLKLWDRRVGIKPIGINKEHTASINCIYKENLFYKDYTFITGSYDEHITLIDLRNFQSSYRKKLNCSIWDINQSTFNNHKLLLTASIYEGFNIFNCTNEENLICLENAFHLNINKKCDTPNNSGENINLHNSIVYGVDTTMYNNELYVVSCSFYDNLILFWKIT